MSTGDLMLAEELICIRLVKYSLRIDWKGVNESTITKRNMQTTLFNGTSAHRVDCKVGRLKPFSDLINEDTCIYI